MAEIENNYGVRSTYYFRAKKNVFVPQIILKIAEMGHEIGYHYECLSDTNGDVEKALIDFENLKKLRDREFDVLFSLRYQNDNYHYSLRKRYDFIIKLSNLLSECKLKVVILGGGVVGAHAAHMAVGMGADVWVLDNNPDALEKHWQQFGRSTNTVFSTQSTVEEYVLKADLVIGGVLIPGAEAPKLVTKEMIKAMKPGSVVVDVAIDQGGCFETSKATTHADPTYVVDDVVHYCVANMPGGVPKTSSFALNNVTLPFAIDIANKGVKQALLDDEHLRAGLNVHKGKVTCLEVAEDLGYEYVSALEALQN